jgi:hypothetical protein
MLYTQGGGLGGLGGSLGGSLGGGLGEEVLEEEALEDALEEVLEVEASACSTVRYIVIVDKLHGFLHAQVDSALGFAIIAVLLTTASFGGGRTISNLHPNYFVNQHNVQRLLYVRRAASVRPLHSVQQLSY